MVLGNKINNKNEEKIETDKFISDKKIQESNHINKDKSESTFINKKDVSYSDINNIESP